jgi:hypothetical protein
VVGIDLDLGPGVQPERSSTFGGAQTEQRLGVTDLAPSGSAAGGCLQLPQLFQRIDPDV